MPGVGVEFSYTVSLLEVTGSLVRTRGIQMGWATFAAEFLNHPPSTPHLQSVCVVKLENKLKVEKD